MREINRKIYYTALSKVLAYYAHGKDKEALEWADKLASLLTKLLK